jgi:hypothetical protein
VSKNILGFSGGGGIAETREREAHQKTEAPDMIDLSKWPSAEAEKYREVIREIRHDLETLKKSSDEGTKIPESIINMFEEFLEGREENVTN